CAGCTRTSCCRRRWRLGPPGKGSGVRARTRRWHPSTASPPVPPEHRLRSAPGMRTTVDTVRGPVALDELGPTLMHEHIFVLDPQALQNYSRVWGASYWDEETRVADAIAKLRRLRQGGIHTLVDPTVPRLGRNIPRIQRINAEGDLNIVAASGGYAFLDLPEFLLYRTDDQITELFVREIREGIDDTGVKAAFLKCCVEQHGLMGETPRILAIVAAASVETDVPVMVHTN